MILRNVSAAVALALCCTSSAQAGTVFLPGAGGSFSVDVTSYREARFQSVVRQQYDFSCGSAALAGLLTHHYDDPVSEQGVFEAMYAHGNQEKIRREGFSMLDMKRYLEAQGYRADGFRISLEKLAQIGVPAITLVNEGGYRHFVIIKGVSDTDVLIGDPAKGVSAIPRARFDEIWKGNILFAIRDHADVARARFNTGEAWRMARRAPVDTALSRRGLGTDILLLPGHNDF